VTVTEQRPRRRTSHRRRIAGGLLVIAIGGSATLWFVRRPIATAVIDRKLAAAHVAARYRIVDLGLGRQRLVDVAIGDPARPDLTASWIELGTRIGLDGARVTAVRAGGVRVRATLANGRLSLGSLDRLLPASTGAGPFRLPAIDLATADAAMHLATPAGAIDLGLSGGGRLDGGFAGRLTVTGARLAAHGCLIHDLRASVRVRVRGGEPGFQGPATVSGARCAAAIATDLRADVTATFGRDLASWRGDVRAAIASLVVPQGRAAAVTGVVGFAGSSAATRGTITASSGAATLARGGRAERLSLAGRFDIARDWRFAGRAGAAGAALPRSLLDVIAGQGQVASGTPLAPIAARLTRALAESGRSFNADVDLSVDGTSLAMSGLRAHSRSGASVALAGGRGIRITFAGPRPRPSIDGTIRIAGGGLPRAVVQLSPRRPGVAIAGAARIAPYAAANARIALSPVRFAVAPSGATQVDTVATVSGPLPNGRIDGLLLPIVARHDARGTLTLAPGCTTIGFDRLVLATLRLDAGRVPLCATGAALVRVAGGRLDAGARLAPTRLSGRLGDAPLSLATKGGTLDGRRRAVTLADIAVRLGAGEAVTRLDIGELDGTITQAGVTGRFARAGGRIGAVPLSMSGAAGGWRLRDGALALDGALTVADVAAQPRFQPLRADRVALTLTDGMVRARSQLVSPAKGVAVADLALSHDLATGTGSADLTVPKLVFDPRFQPDELTRLTFGVIADVRGTINGRARISWTKDGVTSTGQFHTDGTDLAAAFGPVTGLAGTIRFTDLLSLTSAPDQVVTIAAINPGIAVTGGRVVFQTLPGARVRVAGGHWPFAGGALDLRPTLLDFADGSDRRMTFALAGVDAGRFLQQFDFANISATGTFDGVLPMVFDAAGGRIEQGRLRVRRGGGNIAYVGELAQKNLGFWGNLAFGALRSINYRDLSIAMSGPLAGEMITEVRFAGISQGKGARSNFLVRRLQKLPFVFNIRIRAPFRGLIDSAQSFYDPARLVERNLPMLLGRLPAPAGQPGDSNTVP
jgi:hypothetical protein